MIKHAGAKASGLFVTATDTGAGKTRFCTLLLRALRSKGVDAVGFKPFCCGERDDAEILRTASDNAEELALINPVWLRVPASPYAAALVENRLPDIETAQEAFKLLSQRHAFVLVEGVGGWRVPITDQRCLSDFAMQLDLPVLVVAANRLGAINHTQLTVDSVQARGAKCVGVVVNEISEPTDAAQITNRGVLENVLSVPVLGGIDYEAQHLEEALVRKIFDATRLQHTIAQDHS